jgi:hypothetical protein
MSALASRNALKYTIMYMMQYIQSTAAGITPPAKMEKKASVLGSNNGNVLFGIPSHH